MNIHDLAAMTAFYGADERVVRVDDGYLVRSPDHDGWAVLRDGGLRWCGYTRGGDLAAGPFDTPDEAIHALIGDPK